MMLFEEYEYLYYEILESLLQGEADLSSTVQILREKEEAHIGYYPICDWYYSHDKVIEDTTPDALDTPREIVAKEDYLNQYNLDKEMLEQSTFKKILIEIIQKKKFFYDNTTIQNYLEVKRNEQKLSKEQVAEQLEISRYFYDEIIKSKRPISNNVLKKISELYCIDISFLIKLQGIHEKKEA